MTDLYQKIGEMGLIPVVKLKSVEDALPLGRALMQGGLPCAEITFRTAAAEESIRAVTKAFPTMLIGAGTVLTCDQADSAINAGAKFLVSPGLNPKVVTHCLEKGYTIIPGICNPTEIEAALDLGLKVVKFFPAEASGGLPMIKALAEPYGNLMFMPTGGINPNNLKAYLDHPKVLACGGSFMVKPQMIMAGDFTEIERLTREAVMQMLGFEFGHIGINTEGEEEGIRIAESLCGLFGLESKISNSSIFCGSIFELMKQCGPGKNGHIAIATNYLDRAVAYLERQGVGFDTKSMKYGADGKPAAIYLKDSVGGFALHLVQKK
ncbi:MAG: bifunctional 4-hydroxy-2-oxoglutarate aldolase/2-dehydro-3-deoxy-phosphogluconate aldolase [Clostridiales bacterium]|nr:bifunctional 4-hydroxy-2-oxoglutarate aldolase/2-dehydro-3-deoxy-phosphogluconate aldolase [Clostridiales bacterium]